jgi:hypothetical protein
MKALLMYLFYTIFMLIHVKVVADSKEDKSWKRIISLLSYTSEIRGDKKTAPI